MIQFAWLRDNWRLVAIGALVVALGVQTLRVAWLQADAAKDKAAQADAILKLQQRADALSNELVIEQAIAMGAAARKETVYVDRVKRIPVAPGEDDAARTERMRAGTAGVRDILCGGNPAASFCGAAPR